MLKQIGHISLASLILLMGCCACKTSKATVIKPEGEEICRSVNIGYFNAIHVDRIKVIYTPNEDSTTATLSGPANMFEYVQVAVEDSTLVCGYKNLGNGVSIKAPERVVLTLTAPMVNKISAILSADVRLTGPTVSGTLNIVAETAGSITADSIFCTNITAWCNTSGQISIPSLRADTADLETTTAGEISIAKATVHHLKAGAATSGDIDINDGEAEYADMTASTAGSIEAAGVVVAKGNLSAYTAGSISSNVRNTVSVHSGTGGSIDNKSSDD